MDTDQTEGDSNHQNVEDIDIENTNEENESYDENASASVTEEDTIASDRTPETTNVSKANTEHKDKLVKLPLMRVKNIMKMDPDTHLINKEALFLTTKATELFIEYISREVMKHVDGKRKMILKRDFDAAVHTTPNLCFLDGTMESL